ncbi:hypothetical protein QE152_g4543 [Popillia japonica]|uniref:Uncharacterized protein n=1 Tax=Popillia japonica TaxID=7064 RepID=A0AAW1N0H1_POPJA
MQKSRPRRMWKEKVPEKARKMGIKWRERQSRKLLWLCVPYAKPETNEKSTYTYIYKRRVSGKKEKRKPRGMWRNKEPEEAKKMEISWKERQSRSLIWTKCALCQNRD